MSTDPTPANPPAPVETLMELARLLATGSIPPPSEGMESWQISLTPSYAAWLLDNNGGNRRVSASSVQKMSADIQAGRWKANGTTIKISESGRLVDGQHRCYAVIQADTPITTLIVFGVSDAREVFATIDQERQRSVRDIIETTTDRKVHNSQIAATNMLGILTGGVDLSSRPMQAEYLEANIDEIAPWLSWADHISDAAPVIQNPVAGKATLRTVGRTPLSVLAVHMVRCGADADSIQDFYNGIVGELSPTAMRELSDNQLAILQLMLKRLKNGRVLNRMSGSAVGPLLGEMATHINTYNKWVVDAPMANVRTPLEHHRYLAELPTVSTAVRATGAGS